MSRFWDKFSMGRLSGKTLLLIELAVLLVFFCFSAAVCVHLFLKSERMMDASNQKSQAVLEATSIAESLKAADGDLSIAAKTLRKDEDYWISDNVLTFYYDGEFFASGKKDGEFKAVAKQEELHSSYLYTITFTDGKGKELYRLAFKTLKGGAADET